MSHNDTSLISVSQLQREKTVFDILRLLLWEKDENGRQYSIERACTEVGINSSTWRRWVQEGIVIGPLQQLTEELNQAFYDEFIPHHKEILGNLVRMARGLPPEGSEIDIKASDVLAAIREYLKLVPIRPVDQDAAGQKTELEHLETYQPKQLNPLQVYVEGDFIYRGGDQPKMGELEPVTPPDEGFIEGELED